MRYNGVMSTDTMPRFTVIASTDHGDFPLYTEHFDELPGLVAAARRHGAVIIEDTGVEVARGSDLLGTMDDVDSYLATLTI